MLTPIEQVKLEIGLSRLEETILTDDEIQYFLTKNNNNIRRASMDAAKTVLFYISRYVHEKSGLELEIWGHTWYENYMKSLELYIRDPNYSMAIEKARPYAGGISFTDVKENISNPDVLNAGNVGNPPIENDGLAYATKKQIAFNEKITLNDDLFSV